MTNAQPERIEQYLQKIIKLNPFDAVIILRKKNDNYFVELMNSNALFLSKNNSYFPGMDAKEFFNSLHLNQILHLLSKSNDNVEFIKLNAHTLLAVQLQTFTLENEFYYSLILRHIEQPSNGLCENKEIEKHLAFIEHYVDPIISLDLTGNIVYINFAATNKLLKLNTSIIGQNIFALIDKEYKQQFKVLFKNTLEGLPMGMPKIILDIFKNEQYSIKTFPTYWDQKIIGLHIILKNVEDRFISDDSPYKLLSYQDELTGLLNRKALNEQWAEDYSSYRDGLNVALLLVDLDRFKKYNESLGNNAADILLKMVSKRLATLRTEFTELYRYNGDEFVFILRYFVRDEVEMLANRILETFKEPFIYDNQEYFITASIGISISTYGHNNDLESVLLQSEQAVYYAKKNGRFHYRFFRSEMSQSFPNEVLLEAHLRRAIEFNELSIFLQPQIDLHTNNIDSFEALIRWNNRKFGYVPPSQFIPLAESSGIIIEIGDWVLEQVCKHLYEWKLKGYRSVRIAVNISPKQFKSEDFADKIEQLINKYHIDPKSLELEITESSMENIDETHTILTRLKQLGVYVSVDDFGTGYSSLSYLKKYPIDIIKIDQSFIADINKDERNEAIIKAIITLSENLGMDVIAEGVEEKFQEQFLMQHNCSKVQGYLYNKPLPVDEIIEQYLVN